ncbi:MAG: SUMF1/EgtB/PvdO family nonheme iron enzyme, partial [Pseudomonadota bacterium]
MGSLDGEAGRPEGPVTPVSIASPFALARFETSVRQFRHFLDDSGYRPATGCRTYVDGEWRFSAEHDWRDPGPGIDYGPDHPVTCVSWRDARAYAGWLANRTGRPYRLPSEA